MKVRSLAYVGGLALAWVALWDKVTAANVLGGIVVGVVILALVPLRPEPPAQRRRVRLRPLFRLAGAALHDVVASNWAVSRQVVGRHDQLRTGVVACPMRCSSPKVLSTVTNLLALSPDTTAVEATSAPPTIFLHVLALDDVEAVRRKIADLEGLVVAALGSDVDRAALAPGGPT